MGRIQATYINVRIDYTYVTYVTKKNTGDMPCCNVYFVIYIISTYNCFLQSSYRVIAGYGWGETPASYNIKTRAFSGSVWSPKMLLLPTVARVSKRRQ